ncbi:MAG: hypothetical protein IPN75_20005 [Dechloromonas sp.]|uniref:Uncharacterized protein n=1 Tax=Candidatus Dechloromonas phosphorivorans TaxID=2899244 RepID=A0A9D7LUU2_9RHOO|nr:hypothetical protein [Candidatus Dechloromonas phosphorivorans]
MRSNVIPSIVVVPDRLGHRVAGFVACGDQTGLVAARLVLADFPLADQAVDGDFDADDGAQHLSM